KIDAIILSSSYNVTGKSLLLISTEKVTKLLIIWRVLATTCRWVPSRFLFQIVILDISFVMIVWVFRNPGLFVVN
ncbi:hypothetical protein LINPERPRIM_LOCUS19380, partial [Linum perenne]